MFVHQDQRIKSVPTRVMRSMNERIYNMRSRNVCSAKHEHAKQEQDKQDFNLRGLLFSNYPPVTV